MNRAILPPTLLVAVVAALLPAAPVTGQIRTHRVGDHVEPFTLSTLDGTALTVDPRPGHVTILVFVAAHQKRSDRALEDVLTLTTDLRKAGHAIDLWPIISGGEGLDHFRRWREDHAPDLEMLVDAEDTMWSGLGVLVTPTTFILDDRGTVVWLRAGRSFDFEARASDAVRSALPGASPTPSPTEPAADEDRAGGPLTEAERAARHRRRATILAERGDVEAAIAEIERARTLRPGDVTLALELGELQCRAGRLDAALELARAVVPTSRVQEARAKLVAGWASRRAGRLDEAVARLAESIKLDPRSIRAHFELGRAHEQRGDCEPALAAYRQALTLQLDGETDSLPGADGVSRVDSGRNAKQGEE